jgi:hypothetical protein
MGLLLSAMSLAVMSAFVFVPVFVVALAMRLPALRALALSGTFTLGAVVGAIFATWLGGLVLGRINSAPVNDLYGVIFLAAGAAAGGVLAVAKLSKAPPWRRD